MRRAAALLCAFTLILPAQTSAPTIRSNVTEVRLDLVVRDKKSRIVRDLKPEEIQILEDGVPQALRHFEFYEGKAPGDTGEDRSPTTPAAPAQGQLPAASLSVNALRDLNVVSVMIGNLDPAGRKTTRDAMRDFLKNELRPNTYVGVYALLAPDYTLAGLAPYDNDPDRISTAVERALTAVKTETIYDAGFDGSQPLAAPPGATLGGGLGGSGSGLGGSPLAPPSATPTTPTNQASAALAGPAQQIEIAMSTGWMTEYLDAYDSSIRQLAAIRQLVKAQAALPGRKVLLLFMAGLEVHPETMEALYALVSTANRANVTIYAVDPTGYLGSDLSQSRRLLTQAANDSIRQQRAKVSGGDQTVTPGQVMSLDNALRSLRVDTRGNLGELARATGGKLLPNGSDLREPLRRAMEEVRTHYELTYAPVNSDFDAHFRKIEVKVSRPGVTVFARDGYYALPIVAGQEVYPFEMATLKVLNASPRPHDLEFRSEALRYRPGPDRCQYAYAFQVPVRNLAVSEERESVSVHVSFTALVRDAGGQVVDRISKDIPYRMPATRAAELRRGVVTFATPFYLAPGRYTVEAAAVDRNSGKAAVRRSVLVVEPPPSGIAVSDMTLVRRVDAVAEPQNRADPLQARGAKMEPELSDTVLTASGDLRFYAVAYPPQPVEGPVEVTLELARDSAVSLRSPAIQARAEPGGAVPVLITTPAASLQPGLYNARLTFSYQGHTASSESVVTVEAGDGGPPVK